MYFIEYLIVCLEYIVYNKKLTNCLIEKRNYAQYIFIFSFFTHLIKFFSNELDNKSPNVLFIMVDDLRVELGSYGSKHALTPNMDALAKSGTRFDKAYVSVPVCGASRASIATGMRATPDRFRTYYSSVEKDAPDAITLFQLFKENGYHTEGFGKYFIRCVILKKKLDIGKCLELAGCLKI